MNLENERNINNITCDDLYQSTMKKKDVSTIKDSVYTESDEHVDTISDFRKQVDAIKNPIEETHIVDVISTLPIGVGYLKPAVIGIIGQGSMKLSTNLVTHILTNYSEQIYMTGLSPLITT